MAAGRHVFGLQPKTRASKPCGSLFKTSPKPETAHEKSLAPRVGDVWSSYGVSPGLLQQNQFTQDLQLLIQIMNSRFQSLATPTNHTKFVDIPLDQEPIKVSGSCLDVLQEVLRAPHRYFLSHSPRTAAKGRANLRKIHLHLEYRKDQKPTGLNNVLSMSADITCLPLCLPSLARARSTCEVKFN